jgi:hypothetical protein
MALCLTAQIGNLKKITLVIILKELDLKDILKT